ncbi:MAG TPA: biopolymer transporter ExbD [Kofleriaceae bacterium]
MAGGSLYQDDDEGITGINVTPFVDVVLVILVVFIVTAKLIVARGVEVDKPKAATGGDIPAISVQLAVKENGDVYVNGTHYATDAEAIARIKQIAVGISKPKASIAGSRAGAYGNVMHAIDLIQAAGISGIALENVPLSSK